MRPNRTPRKDGVHTGHTGSCRKTFSCPGEARTGDCPFQTLEVERTGRIVGQVGLRLAATLDGRGQRLSIFNADDNPLKRRLFPNLQWR